MRAVSELVLRPTEGLPPVGDVSAGSDMPERRVSIIAAGVDDRDFDALAIDRAVEVVLQHQFLSPTEERAGIVTRHRLAEGTQANDVWHIRSQFNVADDQVPIVLPGFGQDGLRLACSQSVQRQFHLPVLVRDPFGGVSDSKDGNIHF